MEEQMQIAGEMELETEKTFSNYNETKIFT